MAIKYIFSINTGRSGSNYISKIFTHVGACNSFHEPSPICNGNVMRAFSQGDSRGMRNLTEQKVELIMSNTPRDSVYVETNHCFIKGFGWLLPDYLPEDEIGVIILKRDKRKIAESFLRIGSSPLDKLGMEWIWMPDISSPKVKPPKIFFSASVSLKFARYAKFLVSFFYKIRGSSFLVKKVFRKKKLQPEWLIDYQLKCLEWYVEETNAQCEEFKKRFPRIRYYETNIDNLNDMASVREMLAHFRLSPNVTIGDVVGRASNLKENYK